MRVQQESPKKSEGAEQQEEENQQASQDYMDKQASAHDELVSDQPPKR